MRVLAILAILVVAVVAKDACDGDDWGTSGDFDFYVFQQSWSAEFCKGESSYPGCQHPTSTQKSNLTIHGMWPNYAQEQSGHWWPQCCKSAYGENMNQSVFTALKTQLFTYWPNEQDPNPSKVSDSLWDHEWGKHGTCSGMAQLNYFKAAMNVDMMLGTPSLITANIGGTVKLAALETVYNQKPCVSGQSCMVVVTCDSSSTFSGIATCWKKDGVTQMACPVAVMTSNDQCSASTISIVGFGSTS